MRELSSQEERARRIISATLGETVVQHDDGSELGMYDLDILWPSPVPTLALRASSRAAL